MLRNDSIETPKSSQYDDLRTVNAFLYAVYLRIRLIRFLRLLSLALIGSSCIVLILRGLVTFAPAAAILAILSIPSLLIIYVVPVVVAAVIALNLTYVPMTVARFIDNRVGLKDRLATLLSLNLIHTDRLFAGKIVRDASVVLSSISVADVVPIKWTRLYSVAAAAAALTVILLALPGSPLTVVSGSYGKLAMEYASPRFPNSATSVIKQPGRTSERLLPVAPGDKGALDKRRSKIDQAARELGRLLSNNSGGKPSASGSSKAGPASSSSRAHSSAVSKAEQNAGTPSSSPKAGATKSSAIPDLGDLLRKAADKLAQQPLSSDDQQEAAQTLDRVNHKLDGLQMPKTQRDLSSASEDLRSDNQNQAVNDLRSAAYNADHEGAAAPSAAASKNNASQSKDAFSVPTKSGAAAQGTSKNAAGSHGSGSGAHSARGGSGGGPGPGGGQQKPHFGAPREIDPAKLSASNPPPVVSLNVGTPKGRSSSYQGDASGHAPTAGSTVPYQRINPHYAADEEHAVSKEQIPPAYKEIVKKYFSAVPGTP